MPRAAQAVIRRRVEGVVSILELRSGLQIEVQGRVGIISVPVCLPDSNRRATLRVSISPRHPALSLNDALKMLMYCDGFDIDLWADELATGVSPDLVEALCHAFFHGCRRLYHAGICRAYVRDETYSRQPRGQIDVTRFAVARLRGETKFLCRRSIHTTENLYNWMIADALNRVSWVSSNLKLRRRSRALAGAFSDIGPMRVDWTARLSYAGQYRPYLQLHRFARLLAERTGVDLVTAGQSGSLPFVIQLDSLFQRFLVRLVAETMAPEYEVVSRRQYVFEDERGKLLTQEAFLVPDLQIRKRDTGALVLLVDAKYEAAFPKLASGDFYQAHVYGDLLARKYGRRPLPVVLVSPAAELMAAGARRPSRDIDERPLRPVTWLLGIPVRTAVGGPAEARDLRCRLGAALRALIDNPETAWTSRLVG